MYFETVAPKSRESRRCQMTADDRPGKPESAYTTDTTRESSMTGSSKRRRVLWRSMTRHEREDVIAGVEQVRHHPAVGGDPTAIEGGADLLASDCW